MQRDNTATPAASSIQVVVVSFKRFEKNTLRGFVTLTVSPPGITIHDCTYHQRDDGKSWIGWPARSYEKDGQTQWCRIVEAADKSAHWRLQSLACKAVEQYLAARGNNHAK